MVSTTPMSKQIRSSICHVARRARFATWALLVACVCSVAWPHGAGAAEISAESAAKQRGFADIVAKVKPAVIAVMVRLESDAQVSDTDETEAPSQSQPFAENSPLHRYFFGSPKQQPQPPSARQIKTALGSGFFLSSDGYAVTNDHVVEHGASFQIATEDGTTYTAKVVGADLRTDLALLKVDGRNDFPYVKLADHEPRIGDWVIAVGNPYGLGGTVTAGIVSALGRRLDTDSYDDFIQIDAPINKGNSGGPSFDVDGDVIGVNTAIFSQSGGSVGIGFAIPATTVRPVIQQLREKGVVTRGALGVEIQPVTPDIASALGLKGIEGALVAEAQPNGPAAKAGIVPGDVVIAVNAQPIPNGADLAAKIGSMAPGTAVAIGILRDANERTVSVTLGELPVTPFKPAAAPQQQEPSRLGLALAPAASLKEAGSQGVAITEVDPNGLAAEKGLAAGDIILDVSGNPVRTPADVHNAVSRAQESGKRDILIRVKTRDNRIQFVALPIPARQPTLWSRIHSWLHSL
jgi:serine protease Do